MLITERPDLTAKAITELTKVMQQQLLITQQLHSKFDELLIALLEIQEKGNDDD